MPCGDAALFSLFLGCTWLRRWSSGHPTGCEFGCGLGDGRQSPAGFWFAACLLVVLESPPAPCHAVCVAGCVLCVCLCAVVCARVYVCCWLCALCVCVLLAVRFLCLCTVVRARVSCTCLYMPVCSLCVPVCPLALGVCARSAVALTLTLGR